MKQREFKHSCGARDRVLTLPILKGAEPRSWGRSWEDGDNLDDLDWQRSTTE